MSEKKGICFKCGAVIEFDATINDSCSNCGKINVESVAIRRYETVKELHTVTYTLKLDSDKDVKMFSDEHVIILLMNSLKERELLSDGFIKAFELIRSELITKTALKLEELV